MIHPEASKLVRRRPSAWPIHRKKRYLDHGTHFATGADMRRHTPTPARTAITALLFFVGLAATAATGCAAQADAEDIGGSQDELRATSSFTSRGTGYYPNASALEGGFNDRQGKKLKTLQQFLAGSASYVSIAMDSNAFKYGTRLRIKELDAKYGKAIVFRVVDTGGAFRGKGRSRLDVCTANRAASLDPTINGTLHVEVIDETAPDAPPAPASPPEPATTGSDDPPAPAPAPAPATSGSGRACTSDGSCNPGNDGSGEICSAGKCITGCHSNAQCPGSTTCVTGQCR
jgi:3D (Asp-Asp-Asp) domain-containing protein